MPEWVYYYFYNRKHPQPRYEMQITLKPSVVFRVLILLILILLFAGIAGSYLKYTYNNQQINNIVRLFDLDGETNFPAFYSSLALLFTSLLLFFIAMTHRQAKRDFIAWFVLGLVFLGLSLDEATMLHEMLTGTFRRSLNLSGFLYNAWIIPYVVALVAGGLIYLPFLRRLPKKILNLFVVSGVIFISGAVGIELFEGRYEAMHGTDNFGYDLYVAVEEFLEMFGIAVFIYALLKYLASSQDNMRIIVSDK